MRPSFVLHCTSKLLRATWGIVRLVPEPLDPGAMWFVNLIRIEGKRCLLAVHDETRFAVFVPQVVRQDLRRLRELFCAALSEVLALEGIEPQIPIDPATALITNSDIRFRSVLGFMNEMALHCRLYIEDRGSLGLCDFPALRLTLNDTLDKGKGRKYATAMELVARRGGL